MRRSRKLANKSNFDTGVRFADGKKKSSSKIVSLNKLLLQKC